MNSLWSGILQFNTDINPFRKLYLEVLDEIKM